jgi:adenylosuccinate synthase
VGIRVQDLYDEKILAEKLDVVLKEKNQILSKVYGRLPIRTEAILEDYLGFAERLRPYVADTAKLLHDGLAAGKHVMLEGAQGTMLDLDHGTYPFVTSSTPVTGYACASAGFGPQHVERVIGITKAYVTRVGSGPFPTEALDEHGERMGERGNEWGTTTGRKRRCGWFDAVVLRYAARLNGLTDVFLTKLDVLSGFEIVKVCVGYHAGGQDWNDVPPNQTMFHEAEPAWEELPGWEAELGEARSFDDLPKEAQAYVRAVEELAGVRVSMVGVGPAREQTLPVES